MKAPWVWTQLDPERFRDLAAFVRDIVNPRMAALSFALARISYPPLPQEVGVTNPTFPYGNVYRFGADPTQDASFNTSRIQNAIDSSPGIWVDLNGQTFATNALVGGQRFWLRGGTLDFTGAGAVTCVTSTGGSIGTFLDLAANADSGDLTVELTDASSVAVGAYLMLKSDEDWDVDGTNVVSEVIHVLSKSGNVLTLYEALDYSYTTADNAAAGILTYLEDWRWKNVTLLGDPTVIMAASNPQYLKDAVFEDCQAIGFAGRNFGFRTGYNVMVRNPIFEDGATDGIGSGTGYGVAWTEGCHLCTTDGGSAENVNHAVTHGGTSYINRFTQTVNMKSVGSTGAAFDAHRGADHVMFANLQAYIRSGSTADGVISQAARTTVRNVQVSGPGVRNGVIYQPLMKAAVPAKVDIAGVQVDGPCTRVVYAHNLGTADVVAVSIHGVEYGSIPGGAATSAAGIEVRAQAGDIANVDITGANLNQVTDDAIHLRADSGKTITGGTITGCNTVMTGATGENVLINGADGEANVTGITVSANRFSGGAYGVRAGSAAGSVDDIFVGPNGYHNHATANFRNSGANSRVTQVQAVGVDVGDANATLMVGVSTVQQVWNTPLTGARTVALSATGAVNGAEFLATRTAAATGASGLDFGGLKTLAVGEWALARHNGSAWFLASFGAL